MSRTKLIALVIIIALAILALGVYLLFFTLPPTQTEEEFRSANSPFGNYAGSSSSTPITPTPTPTEEQQGTAATPFVYDPSSPLVKISNDPVGGAEVFDRKVTSTTTRSIVRFMERATGHTMEFDRTDYALNTASNTTIPGIYEARWSGNTVLARFIGENKNTIKTFSASLPSVPTSTTQLTGVFLTDNIDALAISPLGNRLFMIPKGETAIGSISSLDGSKKTSIFNFSFNEWLAEWPSEGTITLTTKASSQAPGFMYFLTTTGTMSKALGNINGLSTKTNPSLTYSILSASTDGGIATAIYDFSKNTNLSFTANPTLAEKCIWSKLSKTTAYCAIPKNIPIGNYPDDWYQGKISFVDNIYKIDLTVPSVQLLYTLPADQVIDAINLFLDAKEENLYFTNKTNYSLWGLTIKGL